MASFRRRYRQSSCPAAARHRFVPQPRLLTPACIARLVSYGTLPRCLAQRCSLQPKTSPPMWWALICTASVSRVHCHLALVESTVIQASLACT